LLELQRKQKDDAPDRQGLTPFLRNLGLTERDLEPDPRLILVLTPFSEDQNDTYETIKNTCMDSGFVCVRGDEEFAEGDILTHIVKLLVKARYVIANITTRNSNVFYELGIAHALDKPTILISKKLRSVPFDVKARRILLFSGQEELAAGIKNTLLRSMHTSL
jgi:hypothetical protein